MSAAGIISVLIVTAYTQQQHDAGPMRLGVSTWRRAPDVALPARVKSGANYAIARLARIEVRRLGYDDAILLNPAGRVAEATGACVLIATDDQVVSPPTSEGCLDSITLSMLEPIAAQLGIRIERRPVERTELLSAAECAVAGTISELTLVEEIDGFRYVTDGVLARLRHRYLQVMRGNIELPRIEMVKLVKRALLTAPR